MTAHNRDDSESPSPDHSGAEHGSVDGGDLETYDVKSDHNGDGIPESRDGSKGANIKDQSRPRRKKARRACFACQRAHLTCGTLLVQ